MLMVRHIVAFFFCALVFGQSVKSDEAWLEPWLGTWKLNFNKSKYSPNSILPRSETYVLARWKDGLKLTVSGETAEGKSRHDECYLRYDGAEYTCNPSLPTQTILFWRVNDRALERVIKRDGAITRAASLVLSPDGKTETRTVHETDSQGKWVTDIFVYDKQ